MPKLTSFTTSSPIQDIRHIEVEITLLVHQGIPSLFTVA